MIHAGALAVPGLKPEASVFEAASLMVSEQSSEVFVVDDSGKPVGVVRSLDVVRSVADGMLPKRTTVKEVMLQPPPMVEEDATVEDVSKILAKNEMKRVLVGHGREIVGLIEAGELFNLVSASLEKVEVFKAVSVRVRLRMAELLSVRSMSIDELAEEVGIKPITVRHHIEVLRRNGIIEEFQHLGKVGRPLGLFKATQSVLKKSVLSPRQAS